VFFSSHASVDFHYDLFADARWPSPGGIRKDKPASQRARNLGGGFIGYKGSNADDDEEDEEEDGEVDEEDEQNSGTQRPKIFTQTPVFKLHGSLDKEERAGFIRDFSAVDGGALLASDAASRGLDFPQIDWIIQYDPPQRTEEYLHRVGRTARIGRSGNALLFLQPTELGFLDVLRERGLTNIRQLRVAQLHGTLLQGDQAPADLNRVTNLSEVLAGDLSSHVARVPL